MSVATITKAGRAFMAAAIKEQALHIAWGTGDAAWDEMEYKNLPSIVDRIALFSEVGRRTATFVGFVTPSDTGGIVVPMGADSEGNVLYKRYAQTDEPTPYLYIRCNFDNADAQNSTIREIALFGGTETNAELPPGQEYFTPEQVTKQGFMVAAEIVVPCFTRSPSVRESYEFVLPV